MELFKIEEDWYHYKVTLLGIKFKFKSLKLAIKNIIANSSTKRKISSAKLWLFSNKDNITTSQKIWYLSQKFYEECEYFPNFKQPKSFNEKLNWMKLNYYNPNEKYAIDKYEFKNFIKERLGEGYTIPLYGVYEDVNDIDFKKLPEQFVIKTTANGSATGVHIVKNKKELNIDKFKYDFNNLLQEWNTVYYSCLSRGYSEIKPRIIIEEYLESINQQLYDYKFFCFHGKAKFVYVAIDHFPGMVSKISLYDLDWEKLAVKYGGHPSINKKIQKPESFGKMIVLAEKLAKEFPFVRVDFYDVKGKIYVGELTFTPTGAFGSYNPADFDYKMGEWLDLKKLNPEFVQIQDEFAKTELGEFYKSGN